jgi:hypothetical protein
MKTIVGLYDNMDDAQAAVNDLVQAGFDRTDISLMAADRWAEEMDTPPGHIGTTAAAADSLTVADMPGSADGEALASDTMTSDVTTGAVTGGVVGGLTGVLLGLGVLAIPGFGPGWPARASARPSAVSSARWSVGACRRTRPSCMPRACAAAASSSA